MDSFYEWLLSRVRSPSGKIGAAVLIGMLFSAFAAAEFMTDPVGVLLVLAAGAGLGFTSGVLLTLVDRRAIRQQRPGPENPGCGRRLVQACFVLAMVLGLIALLLGMVAGVWDAVGGRP